MKTNPNEINQVHQSDLYLYFYEDFIDKKRTEMECKLIIESCGLQAGAKILDLACGHGRHSIYLAQQQFELTGIDLNKQFIQLAKSTAKEKKLAIHFQIDNILNIQEENKYDCIFLIYNGFGFLDKADGLTLIQKMKAALKPNGKIFLDIKNRDSILTEIIGDQVTEKGQDLMIDRLSYDPKSGTTTNKRIYIKEGKRYDAPFSMQLYNYTELNALLTSNGLSIQQSYGHWNNNPFDRKSRRIILVIEQN